MENQSGSFSSADRRPLPAPHTHSIVCRVQDCTASGKPLPDRAPWPGVPCCVLCALTLVDPVPPLRRDVKRPPCAADRCRALPRSACRSTTAIPAARVRLGLLSHVVLLTCLSRCACVRNSKVVPAAESGGPFTSSPATRRAVNADPILTSKSSYCSPSHHCHHLRLPALLHPCRCSDVHRAASTS
jgi:hypothetical protein